MSPRIQRGLVWVLALLVVGGLLANQRHESRLADQKIIATGRKSIESGCRFDNQRAHAIRGILRRSILNQRRLYLQGAFTREQYLQGRREGARAVHEIVIRDCRRAAQTLSR